MLIFIDRLNNKAHRSLTDASAPADIVFHQGDTETLRIQFTEPIPEEQQTGETLFRAIPTAFTKITAWVGGVELVPTGGTFKIKIGANTTADLPYNITRLALHTALNALASVTGLGGLTVLEQDSTPQAANYFWFKWTDPEVDEEIEVFPANLTPKCAAEVTRDEDTVSPSTLILLYQAPPVFQDTFESPTPAAPSVVQWRAGSDAQDEVQSLTIPADSRAVFALQFGSQSTLPITAPARAADIATALNALYDDDLTRFEVTLVRRGVFQIKFVGPLARTPHDEMTVQLLDNPSADFTEGTLDFRTFLLKLAMRGFKTRELTFEIEVQNGADVKTPLQVTCTVINDAIPESAAEALEESGAILVREIPVNVDAGLGVPYVEGTAAVSYTVPEPGQDYNFPHEFNSKHAAVRVSYRFLDSPETWRDLHRGSEFDWDASATGEVKVSFGQPLVEEPEEDPWHVSRFVIYITAPEGSLQLFTHQHTFTEVRRSLPGGETLAAVLDEIFAALGIVGGTVKIDATKIIGLINSTQIDINSLIEAFSSAITNNAQTAETWNTMITNALTSPGVLEKLAELVRNNATWAELLRLMMLDILASQQATGASVTVNGIPSVTLVYPPSHTITGPSVRITVPAQIEKTDGDVKTTYTGTTEIESARVITDFAPLSPAGDFAEGSPLVADIVLDPDSTVTVGTFTAEADDDTITLAGHGLENGDRVRVSNSGGALPGGLAAATDYFVRDKTTDTFKLAATSGGSAIALSTDGTGTQTLVHYIADCGRVFEVLAGIDVQIAVSDEGIDGSRVIAGEFVVFKNGHWYVVRKPDGSSTWYATAYEVTLFETPMTGHALVAGKRWAMVFSPQYILASFGNDVLARGRFVLSTAVLDDAEGAPVLDALTWTDRLSFTAFPNAAPAILRGSMAVDCVTTKIDTCTAATNDLITVATEHGLAAGNRVRFTTTGALPAGLQLGVVYYVIATDLTATELKVSLTLGGAAVNITSTGTGAHTIWQDKFSASARLGSLETTWTPASGFLAARLDFREFDPGPAPNGEELALAGSLTVALEGATHSLVELA